MQQLDPIASQISQIEQHIAAGEYAKAAPVFDELFAIQPCSEAGLKLLASCMLKLKQFDQAIALLSDSIDPDSPDTSTVLQLAEILRSQNRADEAGDLLFGCVHANPEDETLYNEAVSLLTELNRTDDLATLAELRSAQ